MSSISSLNSSAIDLTSLRQSLFKKLDTNGDSSVSKEEFVAGRPSGVSEGDAASLYSSIDTQNKGSISEAQFTGSTKSTKSETGNLGYNLSSDVLAVLLQAIDSTSTQTADSSTSDTASSASSATSLFNKIDVDSDGKITESEFVEARPQGVTEAQASALFSRIDTNGTGSIDQAQFEQGLPGNQQTATNANELIYELLTAVETYAKNNFNIKIPQSESTSFSV